MLKVNEKDIPWYDGITIRDLLKILGYTITNPRVMVRVDGEPVPKSLRDGFVIQDRMKIQIINTLCGG